jgi:hypothetical protein
MKWDATSTLPTDNLTIFAGPIVRDPVYSSQGDIPPGRYIRQAYTSTGSASYTSIPNEGELVRLSASAPPTWVKVTNPQVAYYYVNPATYLSNVRAAWSYPVDGSSVIGVQGYTLQRRGLGTNGCNGWNCDPAFETANLGEGEANRWPCEGGGIEGAYLHDVRSNPEGWDESNVAAPVRYGLTGSAAEREQGSVVIGMTAAETEDFTMANNTIENFEGLGVFEMSWWNKGLTIFNNRMDGVHVGITLSYGYKAGIPTDNARHIDYWILFNNIRLEPNPRSPSDVHSAGMVIAGLSDSNSLSGLSATLYPRYDGLEITDNSVYGRPYVHTLDRSSGALSYPAGLFVVNRLAMAGLEYSFNWLDLGTPDPRYRAAGMPAGTPTGIVYYPGSPYYAGAHNTHMAENADVYGGGFVQPVLLDQNWNYVGLGADR